MRPNETGHFEQIAVFANAIGSVDRQALQSGQIGKEAAETILEQCAHCLELLTTALTSGSDAAERMGVSLVGYTDLQVMTLTELQLWCLERAALAREGLYRVRIQQALLQASVWVGDLDAPGVLSEDQAILAAETGYCLLQVLRDAQCDGVPDDTLLVWNSTTITLTAATKLADYVLTTAGRHRQILETQRTTQRI